MTSRDAYDRYNARYDNDLYIAATDGIQLSSAIALQDAAIDICEYPHSILAALVKDAARDTTNRQATFLALFLE